MHIYFICLSNFRWTQDLRPQLKQKEPPPAKKKFIPNKMSQSLEELCEKVTFRVSNGYWNLPTYLPMQR